MCKFKHWAWSQDVLEIMVQSRRVREEGKVSVMERVSEQCDESRSSAPNEDTTVHVSFIDVYT